MKEFNLDKEPKIDPGFKTPDHYFESLSAKVLQRLPQNESKIIPIFVRRKAWVYTAAAILIFCLMIPIVTTFRQPTSEIDNATLEDYLAGRSEISNADLAEFLEVEDIQKMQVDPHLEDKAVEDLLSANSNLEEYIIN